MPIFILNVQGFQCQLLPVILAGQNCPLLCKLLLLIRLLFVRLLHFIFLVVLYSINESEVSHIHMKQLSSLHSFTHFRDQCYCSIIKIVE